MGTPQKVILGDVGYGTPQSRARLLAPLRYLLIFHPEKTKYDFVFPIIIGAGSWLAYALISPKPPIFGDDGLLRFVIDLLIMAVPFIIGALAAVAMGSPGDHMERRTLGSELYLDGRSLTVRAFVCYLLGYLSFLSMVTLGLAVLAKLMRTAVLQWTVRLPVIAIAIHYSGVLVLALLLSFLTVTVFWALYFLTDVVNRK